MLAWPVTLMCWSYNQLNYIILLKTATRDELADPTVRIERVHFDVAQHAHLGAKRRDLLICDGVALEGVVRGVQRLGAGLMRCCI